MSDDAFEHRGRCHCGALNMTLRFTKPADEVQTRSCQCGFCTRQAAVTISDPAGFAVIEVENGHLSAYQFGTRSATSLICNTCGVYAGGILQDGEQAWSIANVRGLAIDAFRDRTGAPMHYEHETAEERIQRRKLRWTPTELKIKV